MASPFQSILLVSSIIGSLIFTTSAYNHCGGVESRYICDASDPKIFHICLSGNKFQMQCPGSLHFNAKSQICDWPRPGLCPYDGYSGLDKESEYDYDEDTNVIYSTRPMKTLQYTERKPTYAPSLKKSPYLDNRNVYRYHRSDNNVSPNNALDNAPVKVFDTMSHSQPQPRAFKARYAGPRSTRRRLRSGRPYHSFLAPSRRRNTRRGSPSGRVFSPFSPPVDAYSINSQRADKTPSISAAAARDFRQVSDQKHTANILAKDPPRSDVKSSRGFHNVRADDVKSPVRSLAKTIPSWVSRLFTNKSDKKSQTKSEQSENRRLYREEENKSRPISKNNHWTEVLGTARMPDSYARQRSNVGKSMSISLPRGRASNDQYYRPKQSLGDSEIRQSSKSNNRQSSQSRGGVPATSSKSNQRIYPYRPGESDPNAPESSAFRNKFYLIQKKQGNKPSDRIGSYIRSVSKYSKKPGKCSTSWCKLPSCRCVGTDIPGDLPKQKVPMMVMLTFDDGVNHVNFDYYRKIFNGSIRNPNGCPMKGTFFVSGDSTDYKMVRRLTKDDHEIASHTLSHRNPTTWWASASLPKWEQEVVGMKNRLAEKSGVPIDSIQGMRAPFLQIGGDRQYSMLQDHKFRYDSSMVTGNLYKNNNAPIWPFTLDTPPDSQICNLTPCPTRSYPGLWEVPLIRWYGSNNFACAMPDSCTIDSGFKGSLAFLEDNFNRHYTTNRAPLGVFIHASWFKRKEGNLEGLLHFLHSLAEKEDVWLVTVSQVLDWIQAPKTLDEVADIPSWHC